MARRVAVSTVFLFLIVVPVFGGQLTDRDLAAAAAGCTITNAG